MSRNYCTLLAFVLYYIAVRVTEIKKQQQQQTTGWWVGSGDERSTRKTERKNMEEKLGNVTRLGDHEAY